jgi:hypothetical protein
MTSCSRDERPRLPGVWAADGFASLEAAGVEDLSYSQVRPVRCGGPYVTHQLPTTSSTLGGGVPSAPSAKDDHSMPSSVSSQSALSLECCEASGYRFPRCFVWSPPGSRIGAPLPSWPARAARGDDAWRLDVEDVVWAIAPHTRPKITLPFGPRFPRACVWRNPRRRHLCTEAPFKA